MSAGFDSIIFDLDGTLWDTCPACAIAWNRVVQRNGIPFREITPADVQSVAGKPHETCIRKIFTGLPEEDLQKLINETPEEDNLVVGDLGGTLYPGVREGLQKIFVFLPLFIVSNCQSGYIEIFLETSGFKGLFKDSECWGNTRKTKGKNLQDLVRRNRLKKPLMVGDGEGDEIAAKECKVPFAFVQYGFGNCRNPDYRFQTFSELASMLLI